VSPSTYNEIPLPSFLYGTAWKKDGTTRLVELAVDSGFRGIDTANQLKHYDEARVGEALLALRKKGVRREDLFLQTKFTSIGGQDQRLPYDPSADPATQVRQSFESSLQHLHTDYLDSYVLHGPTYRRGLAPEDWAVWGAIEELYRAGKTKMIGASNVSAEQLELLCSKAKVKPMLVQNRCFAVMGWDYEVRKLCADHELVYEGFSLLTANQEFFGAPELHAIARRVGAGVAQVIFRFAQQVGMLPLTGTTDPQHMKEDLACERFTLTPEELQQVETIGLPG
jgi:diketogulonate reductase-like aldo/keto reductase